MEGFLIYCCSGHCHFDRTSNFTLKAKGEGLGRKEKGFVFLVFLVWIQGTFSAESITITPYKRHTRSLYPSEAGAALPFHMGRAQAQS